MREEQNPMTTQEWLDLWGDTILRQYIIDMCRAFTRDLDLQEDLIQEAWLRIGQCRAIKTTAYYMDQAFRGMNTFYQREWQARRLCRKGKDYKHTAEALRKRIGRNRKKFRENVRKVPLTHKGRM